MYNPKYLKNEPPQSQEAADMEVFAMVRRNPMRMVDAATLPPIVVDDDGLRFADPKPRTGDTVLALVGVAVLMICLVAGALGSLGVAIWGLLGTVNRDAVAYCIVGFIAIFTLAALRREAKHHAK